jgi:hypothetical protein
MDSVKIKIIYQLVKIYYKNTGILITKYSIAMPIYFSVVIDGVVFFR